MFTEAKLIIWFRGFNPFSPSQLSIPNFSWHNTYKIRHLVVRKWELIKQSKLLKTNSKILSDLFNEKYGLKLGEFNNTTGRERVKGMNINNLWSDVKQTQIAEVVGLLQQSVFKFVSKWAERFTSVGCNLLGSTVNKIPMLQRNLKGLSPAFFQQIC